MSRSDGGSGEALDEKPSFEESEEPQPRYLFPVDGEHSDEVLWLVCDLVADADAELVIASPVTVPEQTPLKMPLPRERGRRRAATFVLKAKQQCHGSPPIDQVVRIGHDREHILQDIADTYAISTLITEDRPRSGIRSLLGFGGIDGAALKKGCDTIIVTRIEQVEAIDSIVVPIARGPHSGLAIDTGLAVARQNEASLELLHVHEAGDDDGRAMGEQVLDTGMGRVGNYENAERTLRESSEVSRAIVEYTHPFDLTVLGAPREGLLRQFVFGTIPDDVSAHADGTVLTAHRGGADNSWLDRWI